MKLLVIGSRSIRAFDLSGHIPKEADYIISGGAKGIDTLAEQYADKHGLSKIVLRPQYDRYGKAAPLYRNKAAVQLCDAVLAIWDGRSRGTKHTLAYAKEAGKPTTLVLSEKEAPPV